MEPAIAVNEVTGLAREAMIVLIHMAAALAQMANGQAQAAAQELTEIAASAPPGHYADEAIYWRARIAGSQDDPNARAAAAKDYIDLLGRLQEGPRKREVSVLLAALAEPGRIYSAEEAVEASRRSLVAIGKALHDYAADHQRRLPGAIEDLLDGYIDDPATLVRPGRAEFGGGRPYRYRPGQVADLRPAAEGADQAAKVGYANAEVVVVWEAAAAAPPAGGPARRLVLRLDGEVRVVQERSEAAPDAAGAGGRE